MYKTLDLHSDTIKNCASYCCKQSMVSRRDNPNTTTYKIKITIALAHFASHRCGPSSIAGLGRGRMCEKFHQLLAVGRWFPPGTPVSSTRKLISSSSFHRLDMTLAVAEALHPNKPNQIKITTSKILRRMDKNLTTTTTLQSKKNHPHDK